MKLFGFTALIFLSSYPFSVHADLYVSYALKSPSKKSQKVWLLGDDHARNKEVCESQLTALLEIIKSSELLPKDEQTKIFFEYGFNNRLNHKRDTMRSIFQGLFYYTNHLGLKNTTIEDCDILRTVCAAASLLISWEPELTARVLAYARSDRREMAKWQACFSCNPETLTFQDVIDNHAQLIELSESFRDSWDNKKIRKTFDSLIIRSNCGLDILRNHLAQVSHDVPLDLNETVWQYSKRYWESIGHKADLRSGLIEAFGEFPDLYMLHRILLLQNDPCCSTIIVCTGSSHSSDIYHALKEIGYRDICNSIVDDTRNPIIPLSSEYLMQILLPTEELEGRMTKTESPEDSVIAY